MQSSPNHSASDRLVNALTDPDQVNVSDALNAIDNGAHVESVIQHVKDLPFTALAMTTLIRDATGSARGRHDRARIMAALLDKDADAARAATLLLTAAIDALDADDAVQARRFVQAQHTLAVELARRARRDPAPTQEPSDR